MNVRWAQKQWSFENGNKSMLPKMVGGKTRRSFLCPHSHTLLFHAKSQKKEPQNKA